MTPVLLPASSTKKDLARVHSSPSFLMKMVKSYLQKLYLQDFAESLQQFEVTSIYGNSSCATDYLVWSVPHSVQLTQSKSQIFAQLQGFHKTLYRVPAVVVSTQLTWTLRITDRPQHEWINKLSRPQWLTGHDLHAKHDMHALSATSANKQNSIGCCVFSNVCRMDQWTTKHEQASSLSRELCVYYRSWFSGRDKTHKVGGRSYI